MSTSLYDNRRPDEAPDEESDGDNEIETDVDEREWSTIGENDPDDDVEATDVFATDQDLQPLTIPSQPFGVRFASNEMIRMKDRALAFAQEELSSSSGEGYGEPHDLGDGRSAQSGTAFCTPAISSRTVAGGSGQFPSLSTGTKPHFQSLSGLQPLSVPFRWLDRPDLRSLTREELRLWESIRVLITVTPEDVVRRMLPRGQQRQGTFLAEGVCVATQSVWSPDVAERLDPGEWICPASWLAGRDLVQLYQVRHHASYAEALRAMADALLDDNTLPAKKLSGWVQETHPLLLPREIQWPQELSTAENLPYFDRTGNVVGFVSRIPCRDGSAISHWSLWRNAAYERHWLPLHPRCPMLYQAQELARRPGTLAHIARDEFQAAELSRSCRNAVASAVSGGTANLFDADLTVLKGRPVHVHLALDDLHLGHLIGQKLTSVGVSDVRFVLSDGQEYRCCDLDALAGLHGVELRLPPNPGRDHDALVAPDLAAFLTADIRERGYVLEPVIPEQGLVMMHAPRGVGKTHVGLGIAYACATGTDFLRWRAPSPRRVLYLDGEMSAADLKARLTAIVPDMNAPEIGNLRILTPDLQPGAMPDIATEEGQAALTPLLDGVSLVILDNLATLCRSGSENGGETWLGIQAWLLQMRRREISVLIIHHSAKSGGQRGTSRREDVLDTVIRLQWPADYTPSQGARFEVHLTKGRNVSGDPAEPFEATLAMVDGQSTWAVREIIDDRLEQAAALFEQNISVREAGVALGISKSAAGRLRQRLIEEGSLGGKLEMEGEG